MSVPDQVTWKAIINGKEYWNGVGIPYGKEVPEEAAKDIAHLVALNIELTLKHDLKAAQNKP